jgi:hypothetical protein
MPPQFPALSSADGPIAERVFEFVQFLLDDDANLTPAGNLTAAARQKFRARLDEIIEADEQLGAETSEPLAEIAAAEPEEAP